MTNILSKIATFSLGLLLSLSAKADILVPAYFYPSYDPNQSYWDEMTAAASQTKVTAIVNPNSGPGSAVNSDYTTAINAFRSAGGRVIAYIPTGYGARSQANVLADFVSYTSFYTIDGVFLDEMSNQTSTLGYYQSIYDTVKSANAIYQVFGNAGMQTAEAFMSAADVLVTYENHSGYESYVPDAWTANYSADRFAHLLYNVATEADMLAKLNLVKKNNVGYVYITDDNLTNPNSLNNPWDTLPGYWNAEVAAMSSVPLPASALLMLTSMGLLGFVRPRKQKPC